MFNNIVFICCAYSEPQKDYYLKNSKRGFQFAAQNFQESIIEGLLQNGIAPQVLSIPSLSTFPSGSSIAVVKQEDFVFTGACYGKSMGFINLPFINCPLKFRSMRVLDNIVIDKDNTLLLVYGLHRRLMSLALSFKKKYHNTKTIIIAPDLPEYMAYNKYYKKLGLYDRDIRYVRDNIHHFDGIVVLTSEMIGKLNCEAIPHLVVEGIYNDVKTPIYTKAKNKVVLYAGGLSERYGTLDLIKAFHAIKGEDYRLWICGKGECVDAIIDFSMKDPRIHYFGAVSKEQVSKYQKEATLLVNPRHGNEEFTKYSFPSKTLEYMASGTPTLMNELPCIPQEYKDFLFFFNDDSVEGMSNRIMEICEMPKEELEKRGLMARDFILSNKTPKEQVGKILSLANRL